MTATPVESSGFDASSERLRTTIKWALGAYAVVGTTMVAGVSITSVRGLEGVDLAGAAVGIAFAFLGLGTAIEAATRVLASDRVTYEEIASPPVRLGQKIGVAGYVRTEIDASPGVLGGHFADFNAFYEAARNAPKLRGDAEFLSERWRRENERITRAAEVANSLDPTIRFMVVRYQFDQAMRWSAIGVAFVVIGVSLFAWASATDAKPFAADSTSGFGSPVVLVLSSDGEDELERVVGPACARSPLVAIALTKVGAGREVVTLPTPECVSYRFVLMSSLGSVVSLCSLLETMAPPALESVKPAAELYCAN